MRTASIGVALLAAGFLAACQPPQQKLILSTKSPVELRAMQARAFDTPDRYKTLRTVVYTLQDLGYTIDKVDAASGTVSATKLARLQISATVSPRGASQVSVRANAQVKMPNNMENQVDDPAFYQQFFFEPLSKALFLQALQE
jgi:hypothetical protein